MTVEIDGKTLKAKSVVQVALENARVTISAEAKKKIQASRKFVEDISSGETKYYAINTGFGPFSDVRISPEDVAQLQINILRSHAAGVGEPFSIEETRAMMVLRANALLHGHSGIRAETVEKLVEFLNAGVIPVVPCQGSVGASGDLAPLSHLALALIGEGYVWKDGVSVPTAKVLQEKGLKPAVLGAKEGLSLINGCQVMSAVGLMAAYRIENLVWHADIAGAMSLEVLKGSRKAFHPLLVGTRPHPGEKETFLNMQRILGKTSEIGESRLNCGRVQDPYSLRCIPAVHGAAKKILKDLDSTLEIEINSSTDNPLVFAEEKEIISCGNFHGEPVAFALDSMAIAVTALSSMSERRTEKMINVHTSGLPAFLTPHGGLNSGFMIPQYVAASLVSENKILSHPASVDTIPTSAGKEDHVSMGTTSARKLEKIVANVENVIAIELMSGCQALDFLRPMKSSPALEKVYSVVRKYVSFAEKDRFFSEDIAAARKLLKSREVLASVQSEIGDLAR
ncbi:MAG: histidine ammonia-lyase [Bdellovibrionales bacterium]|nr:histidine ammonia-lyase [Bdellovibrionales bacterium]